MSGFTEVINRSSENPVFLKTIDDSVTLWYDLFQNVDSHYCYILNLSSTNALHMLL